MVPRLVEREAEATFIDAFEFDLTIQDSEDEQEPQATQVQSDTESVVTVRADAICHDPAEEDDRDSSSASVCDGEVESKIPFRHPGVRTSQRAFHSMDQVNLREEFKQRSCLMHRPQVLEGPMQTSIASWNKLLKVRTNDTIRQEQGGSCFFFFHACCFTSQLEEGWCAGPSCWPDLSRSL